MNEKGNGNKEVNEGEPDVQAFSALRGQGFYALFRRNVYDEARHNNFS